MPDMTPVAQDIQVPNTLNAFANVVGIKQGLTQLQGQQAEVSQLQQQNNELMALSAFTKKAMQDPSYHNEDGSLNVQKFQTDASSVAPVYGQAYIGQATANANEGIQNRQSILNLSNDQRKTAGGYFGALAAKPDASKADYLDAVENARAVSQDPSYQRSLDSLLLHTPNIDSMNPAQQSAALRQYARTVSLSVGSPNAAESAPATQTMQGPKGLQVIQTNPQNPQGVGPVGPSLKQGITPQLQPTPTGGTSVISPSGQATPVTPAPGTQPTGATNWWNPAPGQLAMLQGNTAGVVDRTQKAIAAANNSPIAIDALNRSEALLDAGTWTGTAFTGFKDLKNLAASLGIDSSTAANASELAKNIARAEAARANQVGDTDAARSLTEAGGPNVKVDAAALKAVVQQSLAVEQSIQGYAKVMTNSPDPITAQQRETAFRSVPNMIQAYEAGNIKSQADMDAFLKRYNISAAQLAKSRQMLKDMGAL